MPEDIDIAISIDALGPRLTGIGRYCLELVRGLPSAQGIGSISHFRGAQWIDDPEALLDGGWKQPHKPRWRRTYDNWRRQRTLCRAVVHGPNYFLPEWAERGVVTVHDLSVFLFPETHPVERIVAFERDFRRSVEQSTIILTDTETIRLELVDMFGVSPEKVRTVALGVPPPVITARSAVLPLATLGLNVGQYLLCVSTFEPRKRIEFLVRAHSLLDPALRAQYPLVLAGASGWRNEELNAAITNAEKQGFVRRLDFVDDAMLQALYAGAHLFIYPSGYEGFGLPVVEAMTYGIPCIIGTARCLAEVTRGAARIVDPTDEFLFAEVIADCITDIDWRRQVSADGIAIAAEYTWKKCLDSTVKIYQELARH